MIQSIYRDTPHHLKNKRVQQGAIDKAAANILLATAAKQLEPIPPNAINDNRTTDRNHEQKTGHLNECGKFSTVILKLEISL